MTKHSESLASLSRACDLSQGTQSFGLLLHSSEFTRESSWLRRISHVNCVWKKCAYVTGSRPSLKTEFEKRMCSPWLSDMTEQVAKKRLKWRSCYPLTSFACLKHQCVELRRKFLRCLLHTDTLSLHYHSVSTACDSGYNQVLICNSLISRGERERPCVMSRWTSSHVLLLSLLLTFPLSHFHWGIMCRSLRVYTLGLRLRLNPWVFFRKKDRVF